MTLARLVLLLMLLPHPLAAQLRAVDGLAALEAGDVEGARAIWEPLAERGDVLAQFNLGVLTFETEPDSARALFAQAAAQGHLPAQQALGDLALAAGDYAQARRWLRAVAQSGDAQAQMRLAVMLDQGLGGPVNPAGAALWYQRAAAQGVPEAAFAMGALRAEAGALEEAAQWFTQASAQGHPAATHNLAVATAQGAGVAQDQAAARALYLQAAQAGHAASMHNLALMLARGQGGETRFGLALAWALNADATGHPGAAGLIEALREVMAEDAIAEAEALAEICRAGGAECE
jgi:TPR repeat protein